MQSILSPLARPTARRISASPSRSAIHEYERVSPAGIARKRFQSRNWNDEPPERAVRRTPFVYRRNILPIGSERCRDVDVSLAQHSSSGFGAEYPTRVGVRAD